MPFWKRNRRQSRKKSKQLVHGAGPTNSVAESKDTTLTQYELRDVFTPARPARLTFVERNALNDRLFNALFTPGKQVVVYGHSGAGKTTLLVNKLHQMYEDHITTRCVTGITFDHILLNVFDQLGNFYESEAISTKKSGISSTLQAEYLGIKSKIEATASTQRHVTSSRIVPPQLNPDRLGLFLGEANCCWVLEDFHKIDESGRRRLSQLMKVFTDMAHDYEQLKIIAVGAVGTARQVVEYDANMQNRIAQIYVPLMVDNEVREILAKGTQLLNLVFSTNLESEIVAHSNGIASVCHHLALNICLQENILTTLPEKETIDISAFDDALKSYVNDKSDTIQSQFDKALKHQGKQKFDNALVILRALSSFGSDEGATSSELIELIRFEVPDYPQNNLARFLNRLQTEEHGGLLTYNKDANKYSFSSPFFRAYALALFSTEIHDQGTIPEDLVNEYKRYLKITKGIKIDSEKDDDLSILIEALGQTFYKRKR